MSSRSTRGRGDLVWRWQPDPRCRAGGVVAGRRSGRRPGRLRHAQRRGDRAQPGHRQFGVGDARREPGADPGRGGDDRADVRARQGVRGPRERRHRRTGARDRPRRGDGRSGVDLLRRAAAGRGRPRDLAAGQRLVGVRRRRRVAGRHRRSRPRDGLLLDRQPGADVRRRAARGGQPVHRVRPRARHGDRRAALALPGGAPRHLGRRHRHPRCCCTTRRSTASR